MDEATVRHLARLGKLALTDWQVADFARQMQDIVDLMDTLAQVPLQQSDMEYRKVRPLDSMQPAFPDGASRRTALLEQAQALRQDCYTVPKVVQE